MSKTFNCSGKVNINDYTLSKNSLFGLKDVENVLDKKKLCLPFVFKIFNSQLSGLQILMNLEHHTHYLNSQLRLLERYEKPSFGKQSNGINFFGIREEVCEFLFYMRDTLLRLKDENFTLKDVSDKSDEVEKYFDNLLQSVKRFLRQLQKVPDNIILCAASNVGNKCTQQEYHLYHIHLDLRWSIISLTYTRDYLSGALKTNTENVEKCIEQIVKDLIFISLKIFATISIKEIKEKIKTPYSCSCERELWIMLQMLSDELFCQKKYKFKQHFWSYVHSILNNILSNEATNDLPECKNPELFCLWLTYHLTLLYGYNKNGEHSLHWEVNENERFTELQSRTDHIEKILKNFVTKGGKEGAREFIDDELCIIIRIIDKLKKWYTLNIQIISYLYDCFHKRLDQPFLVQNRGHWMTSVEKKDPIDILIEVRKRLEPVSDNSNDLSSFGLFLNLLGTFLHENDDKKIWNQIKSRIYSRFTENKIKEFSEAGLYNFISLNLTLAVTGNVVNVCTAMINLLPSNLEWNDTASAKKASLVWKGRLIVLILYDEKKSLSFDGINPDSYTETVNKLSCLKDQVSRSMMTWYIDVIKVIFTESEKKQIKDFNRNEYKFLGGWIDRYLLENASDKILTSTMLHIFKKCNELSNNEMNGKSSMMNALWNHLAGRTRLMVTVCDLNTKNYENATKLALEFTIEACRDPDTAKKYKHSALTLFQHFSDSPIIKDSRISRLYLTSILKNDTAVSYLKSKLPNFNIFCVKVWIKSCVLNFETNSETEFFKLYISNLPEIKRNILETPEEVREFVNSDEPIINFLKAISIKKSCIKTDQQRESFDKFCRPLFEKIDKWVLQPLNEENANSKLSVWIYKCVGTIILYCTSILYIKNQPKNTLRLLIDKIALGSDQSFTMQPTQRIFHMIMLGLGNLNVRSDISLQTLIRELFEKYLPVLVKNLTKVESITNKTEVDTLSQCFLQAKPQFSRLMLDSLTSNFITTPTTSSTHKICNLVMSLIKHLLKCGKFFSIDILDTIISICVPSIMKCFIKAQEDYYHRQQTLDILRDFSLNSYYTENIALREKLNQIVWNVLSSYVLTNSNICFEFLKDMHKRNKELHKYLYFQYEKIVIESEKTQTSFAGRLRYLLNNVAKP